VLQKDENATVIIARYEITGNQSINQSTFVYYGMTKCRTTTRSKKAIQLVRKNAGLENKPEN